MTLAAVSDRLLVVVGPSGAGKDSVIARWLARVEPARRPHRVRRTITRPLDGTEDHESLDAETFEREAAAGAFAFQWRAHGLGYGVRWRELDPLRAGRWVVLNGSRAHLSSLTAVAPAARVVEVTASYDTLRARLVSRARESTADIARRLARATMNSPADVTIANDGDLDAAAAALHRWWVRTACLEIS